MSSAIGYRYIQANHWNSISQLVFDIDRPVCVDEIIHDLLLPAPNLLTRNPTNGHGHAVYFLTNPIHRNSHSRREPLRYAASVEAGLCAALGADFGYTGLLTKNPTHPRWQTEIVHCGGYDLPTLADYVDLTPANRPDYGLGRNVSLFEQLRRWAYRSIRQGWPELQQWRRAVFARAQMLNQQFDNPLHDREVTSTSRSVADWVHDRFDPAAFCARQSAIAKKPRPGARKMQKTAQTGLFSPDLTESRQLGAQITNEVRKAKTDARVRAAISGLQQAGERITQGKIVRLTGLAKNTVKSSLKRLGFRV